MISSKLRSLSLCAAILGVMAMSASTAQAVKLSWAVLNAGGTTTTELKAELVGEKNSADLTLLTSVIGLKVGITCTNFELVGVNLEVEGRLTTGGKVKFTGCEAYGKGSLEEALGCKVHSTGAAAGTVESNKGKGELVLHTLTGGGTEVLTKLEPEVAEGAFATFLTEGCILPESNPIKGTLYFKDSEKKATTHLAKHLIEPGPLTSLWIGKDTKEHLETNLDGSVWVKLAGVHKELKWASKFSLSIISNGTWLVLNSGGTIATELKAELVGERDSKDLTLLIHTVGLVVALTCTNFELIGVNLESGGKITNGGRVKFTGCEMYGKGSLEEALGCKLHSTGEAIGTIKTNALKGELVLHELEAGGTERLMKIEPEIGTSFVTVVMEGCFFGELVPIVGSFLLKDGESKAEVHQVKHLIEPSPLSSLYIGLHTPEHLLSSIDASAWVMLGGAHLGLKWSVMGT